MKAMSDTCDEDKYFIDVKSTAESETAAETNVEADSLRNITEHGFPWVILWFSLNLGLAVLMKFVFSNSQFKFPVLLSTVHMLVVTILSKFVLFGGYVEQQHVSKESQWRLRYFVLLFCLNIAFGNIAVKIVNLPLSQMVRSTIPVFIMAASFVILRTRYSLHVMFAVIPIVSGVAMLAYGDIELSAASLVLLLIGNVLAALKVVVTNKYLVEDKLHPIVMLEKLSPLSTLVMFSFAVINGEVSKFQNVWTDIDITTYMWVVISGIISFGLNWSNFMANKKTSPLTMSVLGNLKQVVLVFISMSLFNTQITLLSGYGILTATIGMLLYSHHKSKKK
jgi:drug/metabolite transporter (DMT)-like permease